jgi:hypothetical protein
MYCLVRGQVLLMHCIHTRRHVWLISRSMLKLCNVQEKMTIMKDGRLSHEKRGKNFDRWYRRCDGKRRAALTDV